MSSVKHRAGKEVADARLSGSRTASIGALGGASPGGMGAADMVTAKREDEHVNTNMQEVGNADHIEGLC